MIGSLTVLRVFSLRFARRCGLGYLRQEWTLLRAFHHPSEAYRFNQVRRQTAKTIDSKLLAEIIDELVPENERGRGIMAIFYNISCLPTNNCWGAGGRWEKVEVYRNGATNDEHYATIQWHGAECEQLRPEAAPR
jgi:hypothetical protein